MKSQKDARTALIRAWPAIVRECRQVLGSEQHYQAVVYHCLRTAGRVPVKQLGINVKMGLYSPRTAYWRKRADSRHEDYRGHCEPIPDVALFAPEIAGDWRRRKYLETLRYILCAVEIKASERDGYHLRAAEIIEDIRKLDAHRRERKYRHKRGFHAAVMVIDTARDASERMTAAHRAEVRSEARAAGVQFYYLSETLAIPPVK
jgi:predicted adenine nucleotide alpha hydrolase (AANH) superfamily ATPase